MQGLAQGVSEGLIMSHRCLYLNEPFAIFNFTRSNMRVEIDRLSEARVARLWNHPYNGYR